MALLEFTEQGIYCQAGDFYIDPWQPVKKAVITHAHSDHARRGMTSYIAHRQSLPILKMRLGSGITVQGLNYNETISINGIRVSLHPAGHIIGSSQVRVEHQGEVWVASGDYKVQDDGLSAAFEPVRCHGFITECTFGLPVYRWSSQKSVQEEINKWWSKNKEEGVVSLLTGYSLGKAQRLLSILDTSIGRVYSHGAVFNANNAIRESGVSLFQETRLTREVSKEDLRGALVLAPPSASNSPWVKKLRPFSLAMASGWMQLRGTRRRRAADRGFVLSDHADWQGLNSAIEATGATTIITTHGYTHIFSRWLREQGYDAYQEKTLFTGEQDDEPEEVEP